MAQIINAAVAATLIQLPVAYIWLSLEGLVLSDGFETDLSVVLTFFTSVLIVAATVILALGVPAYLLLSRFNLLKPSIVLLTGFTIPIILLVLLEFVFSAGSAGGTSVFGENYYGTYRTIVENGQRTYWGWVKFTENLLAFGVHGLVGAAVFHWAYCSSQEAKVA